MSDLYQSLSHSKWDCKYHVVFVPKRRRQVLFVPLRRQLGPIFDALAQQKECRIVEGHLMPGPRAHVHPDSPQAPGGLMRPLDSETDSSIRIYVRTNG